jgi:hypothetical protein
MLDNIQTNGLYFKQSDMKEGGYYTSGENGKLIHHEYEEPTLWQKIKHYLYYGYAKNTETRSTNFLYFNEYSRNKICFDSENGDVVSVIKSIRKPNSNISSYNYKREGDKIIVDIGTRLLEIRVNKNGDKISCDCFMKETKEFQHTTTFTYLNWEGL